MTKRFKDAETCQSGACNPRPIATAIEFPEVWTCKDGRKITVQDMDEHHVRAALNMVIRRSRKRAGRLKLLRKIEFILTMPKEAREMMEKHDIGFDDMWPERDKEFS